MAGTNLDNKNQRGQALVLSILFLGLFSTLLVGLFEISFAVRHKIRLQISADAAVLSALNCEANALNTIALTNRAALANDALAAQLNALVSESTFYRKLAERFSRLLRFIPYAGPVSLFLSKGARTMEMVLRRTASVLLPLANISNRSLAAARKGIRRLFPIYTLKAAQRTLEVNMPQAELTLLSKAALIRQTRSLQTSLSNLEENHMEKPRMETMDRHTRERNWRIGIAGISPFRKSGGTSLENGDLVAEDKMRMKVFRRFRLRWKTVLSSNSRASDFGYHLPIDLMTFRRGQRDPLLSLGIAVQSDLPDASMGLPLHGRKLTAVSAATLIYTRPSKSDESPDTFSPFWSARLIPVAAEPSVRKLVPELILREVQH